MELFKSLIVILLSSVLVNNYVLSRFLGICPFLGVSKKLDQATGMGIAVTAVMLLATAVTWPIQKLLLDDFHFTIYQYKSYGNHHVRYSATTPPFPRNVQRRLHFYH